MQLLLVVCFCNFFVLFLFIVQIRLCVIFDCHEKMWEYVMIRVGWAEPVWSMLRIFFLDTINLNFCTTDDTTHWAYLIHWPVPYFKVTVMLVSILCCYMIKTRLSMIVSCIIWSWLFLYFSLSHIFKRDDLLPIWQNL